MLLYLDYIAIICFVLFIIMLVVRLRRIRRTGDYGNAGHFTVFVSWLLIIVFFLSISGIAYGAARPAQFNQLTAGLDSHLHPHKAASNQTSHHATNTSSTSSSSESSSESSDKTPKVVWTPHNPEIADGSSLVRVRFLIPANTGVTVRGHEHHQRYGYAPATDEKQDVTMKFSNEGTYDVIITHAGKTYTKQLEVN
ncbi:MAG: hypothetical protein MRZ92_00420 [Lactobacillus sp.]|nr:hypothetical protein [Lactobacillus sp.]